MISNKDRKEWSLETLLNIPINRIQQTRKKVGKQEKM
nr:MAG TPA: hypothetical protein [Crassvirales sp.]